MNCLRHLAKQPLFYKLLRQFPHGADIVDFDVKLDRDQIWFKVIAALANGDDHGLFLPVFPLINTSQELRKIDLVQASRPCQLTVNVIAINELDFKLFDRLAIVVAQGLALAV